MNTETQRQKFDRLAEQWRRETWMWSLTYQMERNENFHEILRMGSVAVPLILERIRRRPGHWFGALWRLTGAQPIPKEHAGYVLKMTHDWLDWGEREGWIAYGDRPTRC